MTPFEEELYSLIQDLKKANTAFTSTNEDSGNEVSRLVKFSADWDYKSKHDKLTQELAELEKKANRDKLFATRKATLILIKELIPIIDEAYTFARFTEKNTPLDRGVKLMTSNLEMILDRRKGGIIKPEVGDEMDPTRHKAVSAETVAGYRGNTIIEVYRYGYYVFDSIVREAEVKVRCGVKS